MLEEGDYKMQVQIYRDKAGDWRWRLVAANGNVVADSSEGYENRGDIEEIIYNIFGTNIEFNYEEEV